MRKPNYYKQAIEILSELHTTYPSIGLAKHLSTALSDYGDFWGLEDKELSFALEKYQSELALDSDRVIDDLYITKIVEDGIDLLDEEDEY